MPIIPIVADIGDGRITRVSVRVLQVHFNLNDASYDRDWSDGKVEESSYATCGLGKGQVFDRQLDHTSFGPGRKPQQV